MRAFRFILAALILLAAFGLPRLARTVEGTTDTEGYPVEEMKAFLLSRDYPSDYLDALIPPQIAVLYETARDKDAYFYGFMPAKASHANTSRGEIPADELDVTAAVSYCPIRADGAAYVGEFLVSVCYNWEKLPVIRGRDTITVNWDSSVLNYGGDQSFTAYDYFRHPGSSQWETYKTWKQPNALGQGSVRIDTYLDSGGYIDSGTMWGYATGLAGAVNISLDPNGMLSLKTEAVDPAVIHAMYTR